MLSPVNQMETDHALDASRIGPTKYEFNANKNKLDKRDKESKP